MIWRYVPTSAAYYRSGATRPVTQAALREVRDALADGVSADIRALAGGYAAGDLSLEEWALQFSAIVRHATAVGWLLGSGGRNAQDMTTLERIDALIGEQTDFAAQFVRDLAAGGLSDAQMAARAELYAGGVVKAYEEAMATSRGVDLPAYPADGGTPCHGRCRCAWMIEETETEILAWWDTAGDDRVCDGCASRGRRYQPYRQAKG